MEGKLQQRRRLSKERKVQAAKLSPEPTKPTEAQPQHLTPKRDTRVVFSSLEQRRRESKERKLRVSAEAEADLDTPKAKRARVPPVREEEEVFVQVMDAPEDCSSDHNSNIKPGLPNKETKNYNSLKKSHPGKLLVIVSGGKTDQLRASQPTAAKPSKQRAAPKTQNPKLSPVNEHKNTGNTPAVVQKKQLMVLKVKFDQPTDSKADEKKELGTAQARTRTSTRPKKQSTSRSVKIKKLTVPDRPAASSRLASNKQKQASSFKEADRLLNALNLIINARVDRE